jgi:hypothetical protein
MAKPIDDVRVAWNALLGEVSEHEGWKTIPVIHTPSCQILAARLFPENVEAILIGFNAISLPRGFKLPEGNGFYVASEESLLPGSAAWISLVRKETGNLDLYLEMVGDILSVINELPDVGENAVFTRFVHRIRLWQDFMTQGAKQLGPEVELGLFGELTVLRQILNSGVQDELALEGWGGPEGADQDFRINGSAFEVKSTTSTKGFPAKIGSLEQLDDSLFSPLYLVGLKFEALETGITLPELIGEIIRILNTPRLERTLRLKLLSVGYHESQRDAYARKFVEREQLMFKVGDDFPRLTHGSVGSHIKKASYEVELSGLEPVCTNNEQISKVFEALR